MPTAVRILEKVSRAMQRVILQGSDDLCAHCQQEIKFNPKRRTRTRVICNVYVDGRWVRVELYHPQCYGRAGNPYGPVQRTP